MSRATLRARTGATAATLTAVLSLSLIPAFAATASASPAHTPSRTHATHSASKSVATRHRGRTTRHIRLIHRHDRAIDKVLKEASRQKGKPYSYGADGPHSFDCSGLVRFVYGHSVHHWLPHNAAEQFHSLHHIKRNQLRKGDLIFTDNGYISHVGIFAGHHHWWVAPHTGTHVQKQRIYHAHFVYARVLRMHFHRH
jgi:cell wall-associated NlpC family hydrolase